MDQSKQSEFVERVLRHFVEKPAELERLLERFKDDDLVDKDGKPIKDEKRGPEQKSDEI